MRKKKNRKTLFSFSFSCCETFDFDCDRFFVLSFLAEAQMALLTGCSRPSALMGARRDLGRSQGKNPSAATDRLCRSPQHLLVSPPYSPPLPLMLHGRCQRRGGQSTSLLVTLAATAAAGAAAGSDSQQQPQQKQTFQQRLAAAQASKKKKKPLPARLLSSFLATSSVPYR